MTDINIDDALRTWASDWADSFDQSWDEATLQKFVGKTVAGHRDAVGDEGPKGFSGRVVGYSVDHLYFKQEQDSPTCGGVVHRYSLILDNGTQVALLSGMMVVEGE